MNTQRWCRTGSVGLLLFGVLLIVGTSIGQTQTTWVDEIGKSLNFYKVNYPASNWEPYSLKLETIKEAVNGGDQRTVKMEMGKWFKMLRTREYGSNDVAADELFNFALMVTPIQEYGISVPAAPGTTGEVGF
ncbi:MAG TPA: hypothetical protein VFG71_08150 [Nitrospiraceae bacterium]|nr:hypothetical protein [Nitrospiraceae bacterium]